MQIRGRIGDRPWTVTLPLAAAAEGRGLSKLWARRKIADAEVAQTTAHADGGCKPTRRSSAWRSSINW